MATVPELLQRVANAPNGSSVAAFFDYDGTVIDHFSAGAFYQHRIRHGEIGPLEFARTILALARRGGGERFDDFLDMTLGRWRGKTEAEMAELGEKLFKDEISGRLHWEVWELVEAHRAKGHRIAITSPASGFQVAPMARALCADDVLCTPVEVVDGVLTGRMGGPALGGDAKADAVKSLMAAHQMDPEQCFAYASAAEDIPFLESVGKPACVNPDARLGRAARQRDWPVLRCAPRGGLPSVGDAVRTAGCYGSLAGAFAVGLGVGLLNRSRSTLVDITGGVGSDIGLAVAGVEVQVVRGAEHLWSARPCVFIFNHQSKLDPLVVMKLLRGGYTGVAKKEAANVPGFGQFFRLAGVAFVDRGNTKQAREALEPAVRKVRDDGLSLVIAPEGTRSATPRLGRFKKGAFHIAMQAGVSVVPIVMRNVGEVMWRGSQTIRPGTVEVAILDPVDTTEWTVEDLADRVAEVRASYIEILADWPGADPQKPRSS